MKKKDAKLVKSILGNDIFDELKKSSIYQPETKTALNPEEIRIALEIVPRSVLGFLFAHLKNRSIGEVIDIQLPWSENTQMHVNKLGQDNFNGEIVKDGKKIYEFMHRSIPSLGLVLMSVFELYDIEQLNEIKQQKAEPQVQDRLDRLQDIIHQRLMLQGLIQDVVDKRISEREAISKLIKEKLQEHIEAQAVVPVQAESTEENKKSKLRQFLDNREKKRQEAFELDKSEDIHCPDCASVIYKKEASAITPCICYGEFFNKNIKITKSENNKVKINFPKSFDIENIEMLLEALKNNK